METIEIFLYDKWQIKENLERFFKAEILEHKPAYVNAKLYKTGTKYNRQTHLLKTNRYDKIVFGSYIKMNIEEKNLKSFLLIASQEDKRLDYIDLTTFSFKNLDEFLKNKIIPLEVKKCYTLISERYNIGKNRHNDIGNFEKNFLITF